MNCYVITCTVWSWVLTIKSIQRLVQSTCRNWVIGSRWLLIKVSGLCWKILRKTDDILVDEVLHLIGQKWGKVVQVSLGKANWTPSLSIHSSKLNLAYLLKIVKCCTISLRLANQNPPYSIHFSKDCSWLVKSLKSCSTNCGCTN